MPTLTRNELAFRVSSGVLLLVLLALAAALVIAAAVMIDVIDEGLMHNLTTFESEPKEGWDYWRWKAIKEAMPSWIICGGIWLSLFGATLYFAYRSGRNLFLGHAKA